MSLLLIFIYLIMIALSVTISIVVYRLKNKYNYEFLNLYLIYIISFCIYASISFSAKIWFFHFFHHKYSLVISLIVTILLPVHLVSNSYLFLFFQKILQKNVSKVQYIFLVFYQSIIFILFALSIPNTSLTFSNKTNFIKLAGILNILFITAIIMTFFINSLKTKDSIIKNFTFKLSLYFLLTFPLILGLLELTNISFSLFSDLISGYFFIIIILFSINIPPLFFIHFHLKNNRFNLDSIYKKRVSSFLALSNYNLTEREREIAELVVQGKTNYEIGDILFISDKTVKNNITKIYRKTGVKNRVQLTMTAKNQF